MTREALIDRLKDVLDRCFYDNDSGELSKDDLDAVRAQLSDALDAVDDACAFQFRRQDREAGLRGVR